MLGVVTAWSAISACGIGRVAFETGVSKLTAFDGEGRDGTAYVAADFVVEESLGTRGTGSMDRSTALAIGVVGDMVSDVDPVAPTGVVLGTTSGSAQTRFTFTQDSLTRRKPYFVNPAMMPFALMNSAASQCAIWHGFTGPNTTIAGGRMSGLAGLRYAARLLATGRAGSVVCGAVEEYSATRAWLERHRAGERILGEGAAVVLLEPPDSRRRPLAQVLAIETRVAVNGDLASALTECLLSALLAAGLKSRDVDTLAVSAPGGGLALAERTALESVLGYPDSVFDPGEIVGDVGAATGFFQIGTLLRSPGIALMTGLDEDGTVGCAVMRVLT